MWLAKFTFVATVLVYVSSMSVPAVAASRYKCKVKAEFGSKTVTFKKGRATSDGYRLGAKLLDSGAVELTYDGGRLVLLPGGKIKDHTGAMSGSHSCEMENLIEQLK